MFYRKQLFCVAAIYIKESSAILNQLLQLKQ